MKFCCTLLTGLLLTCLLPAFVNALPLAVPPRTGQTSCWTEAGTVTACAGTGQDGDLLGGSTLPVPRFKDNGDKTITDNLTGLIWSQDANPLVTPLSWQQALDAIKTLNGATTPPGDWRLPNRVELLSLINAEQAVPAEWLSQQGFTNVQQNSYWSSTTDAIFNSYALPVNFFDGLSVSDDKAVTYHVWPVRAGLTGTGGSVALPQTGQSNCWDEVGSTIACSGSGQDGAIRAGAIWPAPRFTFNSDLTATDNLTGLVWSKDIAAAGQNLTWQQALNHITALNSGNYLAQNDWRLPNKNELATLLNEQVGDAAAWLTGLGFTNIDSAASYWTATSLAGDPTAAQTIYLGYDSISLLPKIDVSSVWPVRGGEAAARATAGICGPAAGAAGVLAPSAGLCAAGAASAVSADSCCGLWQWTCAGSNNGATATCSAGIQYELRFTSGANGSIAGSVTQTVNHGAAATAVTATAASGYHLVNWSGNGSFQLTAANPLIVTNVQASMDISANFAPNPINSACGTASNGLFLAAPTSGLCTTGTAATVSADSSSGLWRWTCSGSNGGTDVSCTAGIKYQLRFTSSANGSLTGNLSQIVNHGAAATAVTANASNGAHFVNWTGSGGFVTSTANPLRISNVTASMDISANFAADTVIGSCGTASSYALPSSPVANLCASGTASTVVDNGSWSWTCAGVSGGSNASCTAAKVPYPTGNVTGGTIPGVADALLVLRAYLGKTTLSANQKLLADVAPLDPLTMKPKGNGGEPDLADVIMILRRVVGAINW